MNGFEKVAQRSEIKAGELKVVVAQGEEVVLTELAGKVIAFSNVCSHEDCTFVFEGEGKLEGAEIECD
ncbi:MAG: Rieske 2Fe-2S domain-containing protein, partial [Chloroflexi bacterium]|nr:Rieske 2Fe-2S domain-containing protein [Chloroflexota bacterium]